MSSWRQVISTEMCVAGKFRRDTHGRYFFCRCACFRADVHFFIVTNTCAKFRGKVFLRVWVMCTRTCSTHPFVLVCVMSTLLHAECVIERLRGLACVILVDLPLGFLLCDNMLHL